MDKIHSRTNKLRANSKSSCTLTKPETRNTLNTQLTSSRRGLYSVSMFHCCAVAILQSNDTVVDACTCVSVCLFMYFIIIHTTCVVWVYVRGVRAYVRTFERVTVCLCERFRCNSKRIYLLSVCGERCYFCEKLSLLIMN